MTKNCVEIKDPIEIFWPGRAKPHKECINCILDDILRFPEGPWRVLRISLYKAGLMQLNCEKTGIRYQVNRTFFNQILKDTVDI